MNDAPYCQDYATDDTFEVGDVVCLIVGGPDMVVIDACECGTIEVAWVKADGDVMVDAFPEEALVDAPRDALFDALVDDSKDFRSRVVEAIRSAKVHGQL